MSVAAVWAGHRCVCCVGGVCTSPGKEGLTTVSQICRTKSAYLVSLSASPQCRMRLTAPHSYASCCSCYPLPLLQEDVAHFCLPLEYQLELPVQSGGALDIACTQACSLLLHPSVLLLSPPPQSSSSVLTSHPQSSSFTLSPHPQSSPLTPQSSSFTLSPHPLVLISPSVLTLSPHP